MKVLQLTYNSPFEKVLLKVFRSSGNKALISVQSVKGSGRLSLEVDDNPKYKGNYTCQFFDLFNNALTIIEVEPIDKK